MRRIPRPTVPFPATPNGAGQRLLYVAMELMMSLYALLYAFPFSPVTVLTLNDSGVSMDPPMWFNIQTSGGVRAALDALLRTSEVLGASLAPGRTLTDITVEAATDLDVLSRLFGLRLFHESVPSTCRVMYRHISGVYAAVIGTNVTTREHLLQLYRQYLIVPWTQRVKKVDDIDRRSQSALLEFCTNLTTLWMQPYFAQDSDFYLPRLLERGACRATG